MEVVRKLELEDIEDMIELRLKIQNHDKKHYGSEEILMEEEELREKTRDYLKENLNKVLYMFGLFIDNKLIANSGFYLDKHFPTYNNPSGLLGYICNVYTEEKYRNKGYQKKVFNYCLNYGKELGITSFKLSSVNEKAINMYKHFGFNEIKNMYSYKVISND